MFEVVLCIAMYFGIPAAGPTNSCSDIFWERVRQVRVRERNGQYNEAERSWHIRNAIAAYYECIGRPLKDFSPSPYPRAPRSDTALD